VINRRSVRAQVQVSIRTTSGKVTSHEHLTSIFGYKGARQKYNRTFFSLQKASINFYPVTHTGGLKIFQNVYKHKVIVNVGAGRPFLDFQICYLC